MKEQITITKENIIKDVAKRTKQSILNTKDFYNALESAIFDMLKSVNEEQDIHIKLFEGISLDGTYIPEKMKTNNLTGETNLVSSKTKPKFNITRSYIEKLNDK